ncbi:hypothetical protein ETD86_36880 [Nonomuraea turkmeniaca]|uniref:Alpha/beta hydrolase n=1 Tax=Nonomuraea turkmeniaca TaxID=103838 RepID=A0A5S4F519_9ACTN|nr:hypothetical protein [Nonomuraea turkmeniaca]TMR11139.1 hypothetical protein ETD86_36880 [Nonomuraea turkmeniaca]
MIPPGGCLSGDTLRRPGSHRPHASINSCRTARAWRPSPGEFHAVPDTGHVDLYDKTELIPFDQRETFFNGMA